MAAQPHDSVLSGNPGHRAGAQPRGFSPTVQPPSSTGVPGPHGNPRAVPSGGLRAPGGHFGNQSNPIAPSGACFGIWPPGGQEYYANGCYGHDEPGIQFYSTLGGSGGNVTWNVTLPVGRNSSAPQSALYTAIWFGMTLSDPYAWMDQCFLELQFYPDSDWYSSTPVYGEWVGAAVAWQIEALTGYEDACFYQALSQTNGLELAMTQGDQISITMTGWVGDPYGENLTIRDVTNGETSYVTLYNTAQNYPLDPAYGASDFPNSLQWTPGGEFPVVFAFETGHTVYPYPNNNSYGGCSSGPPPSTIVDPAVPCPSYDPGSWVNDTVKPWKIATPTFFNATARETPAQVSFSQDLGGISLADWLSNYTCAGRDGSAWCSYPWYSYSCTDQAFEFGATNYASTTTDFGGYRQYSQTFESDAMQMGFYPPTNFSVPTCGAPSYTLSVSATGAGSAYFLSEPVGATRSFDAVGPGEYSLSAIPSGATRFQGWAVSGALSVVDSSNPTTTLWVRGNGTVLATFSTATVVQTPVTFDTYPSGGHVVVNPSFFYTTGIPVATVLGGATLDLAPGTYSIQAYPLPGYNFSAWSISGGAAEIAAPELPYTWLVVPGGSSGITVNATSVSSASTGFVYYGTYYGRGTVSFDGGAATSSGSTSVSVGTYTLEAFPGSGYAFDGWYISSSGVLSDFSPSTNITIENGTTYAAYAFFELKVQVQVSPSGGGRVSFDWGPPLASQSTFLFPGFTYIAPAASAGYSFSSWSVSNRADAWVYPLGGGLYGVEVNYSATITATFVSATAVNLSFSVVPTGAGTIEFNFDAYEGGQNNSTLALGDYRISAVASPGFNFSQWSVTGTSTLSGYGFLDVSESGDTLVATFTVGRYPVTIVTNPPQGAAVRLSGGTLPSATTVQNGATLWVGGAGLSALAVLGPNSSFVTWAGSPALSIDASNPGTLSIGGPGTLTLFSVGFGLTARVGPAAIDLGQSIALSSTTSTPGSYSYSWGGLPPGCTSSDVAAFSCTPSTPGTFSISLTAFADDGTSRTAAAGSVLVVPDLTTTALTASPASFTLGGSTRLSVLPSNGIAPYQYQYGGLPVGCSAPSLPTFTCTPLLAGVSVVALRIVDANGYSVTTNTTITVNAPPALVAFNTSRSVTDVGLPVILSVWGHSGTPPVHYSYSGLPPGCASTDFPLLACTPDANGTFELTASLTDADGFSSSLLQTLTVNADPQITSFGPVGWSGIVNTSLTIVLRASGGTGPLRISYTGLPTGCAGHNSSSLNCTPSVVGNYSVRVTATDALGLSAVGFANVSVSPEPAAIPHPAPGGGSSGFAGLPWVFWLALVAALIVSAAVGVLLYRRPGPPASSSGESSGPEDETAASESEGPGPTS